MFVDGVLAVKGSSTNFNGRYVLQNALWVLKLLCRRLTIKSLKSYGSSVKRYIKPEFLAVEYNLCIKQTN